MKEKMKKQIQTIIDFFYSQSHLDCAQFDIKSYTNACFIHGFDQCPLFFGIICKLYKHNPKTTSLSVTWCSHCLNAKIIGCQQIDLKIYWKLIENINGGETNT